MEEIIFKAIGTAWSVLIDVPTIKEGTYERIVEDVDAFEKRFSRFLPDSEVNAFREATAGSYEISEEFAVLLGAADTLRELTGGVYDPVVSELLERAGYNKEYSLNTTDVEAFSLSIWSLNKRILTLEGPTAFDLGGIGKGYCIDLVAGVLNGLGYEHYIVEAGGDMYGTTKADGTPWRVALQYPGREEVVAGTLELNDRALAVSDSFRRRWGKWHHIVDPKRRQVIESVIGASATAKTAFRADCMTSGLFLAPKSAYETMAEEFDASYLVFNADGSCVVSNNWKGELYE